MKYITIVLLVGLLHFICSVSGVESNLKTPDFKYKVYNVLEQKCNICHKNENPKRIFTLQNMDKYARKINRQVFVWKRMPKGNKIKLTPSEKEIIRNWIKSLK